MGVVPQYFYAAVQTHQGPLYGRQGGVPRKGGNDEDETSIYLFMAMFKTLRCHYPKPSFPFSFYGHEATHSSTDVCFFYRLKRNELFTSPFLPEFSPDSCKLLVFINLSCTITNVCTIPPPLALAYRLFSLCSTRIATSARPPVAHCSLSVVFLTSFCLSDGSHDNCKWCN